MSRIHEALKRAEQERAVNQFGQANLEPAAPSIVSQEIETSVKLPEIFPSVSVINTQTESSPKVLKFEELWASCASSHWKPDPSLLVFANANAFAPGAEQFRTLRSRLYRIRESQPLQTLLISSAIPAEGKTLISTNLAYAIVRQPGCRVLLIDADLRAPRIHALLGTPQGPGLADYLQAGATETEVIHRGQQEGLCFIPAGQHATHPSELISSSKLKTFLERMKSAFDWIIIDSPPALPVADASILGGLCDGVLFVVRAGSTPSEASKKACQELRGAHIIGVALNTAEDSSEYGSYYNYSGYGKPSSPNSKK